MLKELQVRVLRVHKEQGELKELQEVVAQAHKEQEATQEPKEQKELMVVVVENLIVLRFVIVLT